MTRPTGSHAAPALEVRDLRIGIARSHVDVVSDVSLSLDSGQVIGLVGESASGKTTVGLALLGYCRRGLEIRGGSVLIGGENLLAADEHRLRDLRGSLVCYVPQDPATALNPALSIRTQLTETIVRRSSLEETLIRLLTEVRLPANRSFLDAYPHQLSGGQQQRVTLAMAFANRPRLIVMDEPTTGLDVTTQAHVLETVRQLCARHGVAAVYVTHDLAVVANLATHVAVMYAGLIVETGPTSTVLGEPAHPYTRALIRAIPALERATVLRGIPGQAPEPGRRPRGCRFAPRCELVLDPCRASAPPRVAVAANHAAYCIRTAARELAKPYATDQMQKNRSGSGIALKIEALRAMHGSREVLHEVSLDIPERSCVALVGEFGSGKTTLARCIAGLHRQLSGSMLYRGTPLEAGSRHRHPNMRRRIQYIFQNPYASLNPRRSIRESITVALREFEALRDASADARVAAVLDSVALPMAAAERLPRQLSGGQRQRACIARALVLEPELLICDEVTSALDVSVQAVIIELLVELQRERGLTMLFVTHNLPLMRSIAQYGVVMHEGRIVERGEVSRILQAPETPEAKRLIRDAPRFIDGVVQGNPTAAV